MGFTFQNPFAALRQRNILAPQFGQQGPSRPRMTMDFQMGEDQQRPQPMDERPRGYEDDLSDMMTSVGPGVQAYRDYLTKMPQREDYKPNWMTRIAAGLSGLSAGYRDPGEGVRVAQELNNSPYRRAMTDYAAEGVGLKERAGMEQDELDSKIRALQNARAMGLKYDEFKLKQLESQSKMTNDTTTANAAMKRAEAYAAAQARPGYDSFAQEDGSVLFVNKNDPNDKKVVPAKTVQAGQLGVARQNAATSRGQLDVARTNAETNRARQGSYDYSVRNPRPAATRPNSPRVQQDAEDNALRQMMSDPLFKDFIKTDKDGFPIVSEDDGSEDYQDFLDALDAKTQEVLSGSTRRGRRR